MLGKILWRRQNQTLLGSENGSGFPRWVVPNRECHLQRRITDKVRSGFFKEIWVWSNRSGEVGYVGGYWGIWLRHYRGLIMEVLEYERGHLNSYLKCFKSLESFPLGSPIWPSLVNFGVSPCCHFVIIPTISISTLFWITCLCACLPSGKWISKLQGHA